ncbi:MAG: MBL fold metallo-hydrolase [Verrucomicrobia bacterium]|nr:MBL fold metallo-hydrolase [Verrucomicrobiota bacterium]
MDFVNLTRHLGIGANSYWIRVGGKNIILDAGADPKVDGLGTTADFSKVPEGSVDAIIITHAHQDHIGSLPVLTRREPQAPVFMTEPTAHICEIMLHNSVSVMTRQREELSLMEYPLFTHRGVDFCEQAWVRCGLRQRYNLAGEPSVDDDEVTFEFYHAGHILGSAGVLIRHKGKSLFYTGDVNFENQTIMSGAAFPEGGVDFLIMETTRGDAQTPAGFSRASEEERFSRAVRRAIDDGGTVTIPVFALGKTQEILAILWKMRLHGEIPALPIYIGGLSVKVTTVYDALAGNSTRSHPELQLLQEMAPYVLSGREIVDAMPRKKAIYALSSGMMTEHTLSNIFARRILSDASQTLLFVGYSDPDSPAAKVRKAAPGDEVKLDKDFPAVPVRCRVEEFSFSAHSSREMLRNYVLALKPAKIVLVHGDEPAMQWFQLEFFKGLEGAEVVIPVPGRKYSLE